MRTTTSGTRAGFTLLELTLALGLLAVFLGSTALVGRSMVDAFRTETSQARYDEELHLALDRMAQRLRAVDGEAVLPAAAGWTPWLEFQPALDHDGTAMTWGPLERIAFELDEGELDDDLDNDGDGLVDEGRAVWLRNPGTADQRRVVLAPVVPASGAGEIEGNGVDDDGDGLIDEGGLAFEVSGSRVRIQLTLAWSDPSGLQTIDAERVVVMRNTGVNSP